MTKILITGAGGFIGQHLSEYLHQRSFEVVCLHRSRADATKPPNASTGRDQESNHLGQTIVRGDIRDPDAMAKAIQGVDWVFHLAASVATKSLAESLEINVTGTRTLAQVAANCPTPPRLVYVSSLAAAGPSPEPVTESTPCHPVSHYGKTKRQAELELIQFANQLPISIVRPPCVFGPGDRNMLNLYAGVQKGWNPMLSATDRYSFLHVDDLVKGLVSCAEHGQSLHKNSHQDERAPQDERAMPNAATSDNSCNQGIYYLADPQAVTFVELADMIGKSLGVTKIRHIVAPKLLCWGLGALGDFVIRTTGKKVFLNLDKVREGVGGSWVCDSSRAKQEFGFDVPLDLEARIVQTTHAYRQAGWIDG